MNTRNLTNKKIWITGASSGLGVQLAFQLNEIGSDIIISARREEKLIEVQKRCPFPDKVKIVPMDLTDHNSISSAVKDVINLGGLDILINNAGIAQKGLVSENSMEVDRQIMETNYFGTVDLSKEVLPYFLEKKKGWFVVVTSIAGVVGIPGRSAYSASKHALHGFFDSLRAELYDCDLDVTIVMPGFVNTHITYKELDPKGHPYGKGEKSHKLGMSPEECAKKIIKGIKKNKHSVVVGGIETSSLVIQKVFPTFYDKLIRKHPMKLWRRFLRFLGFKR